MRQPVALSPTGTTLSTFLQSLADQLTPESLRGAIILAALDRPIDHLIQLALGLGPYHPGEESPWSHTFLLADCYSGPGTPILDCTIRDAEGKVPWDEPLDKLLSGGLTDAGGIYTGAVGDYDDPHVTRIGLKLLADLTEAERQKIVDEAGSLRAAGYRYDIPGLVRELVRLLTGIAVPPGEKLLFCSAFCQAAYRSALGPKGDFAPAIANEDTTPDDLWYSARGIQHSPVESPNIAPTTAAPLRAPGLKAANTLSQIEHVVVLMLENRSFDHLLGFLKRELPSLDGLDGSETNPGDPGNGGSPSVSVTDNAEYVGDLEVDPGHDQPDVGFQLYGTDQYDFNTDGKSNGFVLDYTRRTKNDSVKGARIMRCFAPERVTALATLAREFAICDHWYSSLPGPTWPNRFFAHAATSNGHADNAFRLSNNFPTIYHSLQDAGVPWKVYFHDIPQALAITSLWASPFRQAFTRFEHFLDDAQAGTLPAYSFIEPRYFHFFFSAKPANDAHPPHDVSQAEVLISDVYNALRASPAWEKSALLILFDEHGGTYDHRFPPKCVNPDQKTSAAPPFDFTRLGVRVPAVIVSPYIPKGTIDRNTYDHASVLALLEARFGLPPLTERDKKAGNPGVNFILPSPRQDTPPKVSPAGQPARPLQEARFAAMPLTPFAAAAAVAAGDASTAPISDYQQSLIDLAQQLPVPETPAERALRFAAPIATEHDAAIRVRERVKQFLGT
jgi:phospholipase C